MYKIIVIVIFKIILINHAFTQSINYQNILFNQKIDSSMNSKSLSDTLSPINKIFGFSCTDKVNVYFTLNYKSYTIDSFSGVCKEINYTVKDSSILVISRIDTFLKNGYYNFNNDLEYKEYIKNLYYGLIVAVLPYSNKVLLIHVNSCVYEANLNYVVDKLKNLKEISSIYVFNCGGNPLVKKVI